MPLPLSGRCIVHTRHLYCGCVAVRRSLLTDGCQFLGRCVEQRRTVERIDTCTCQRGGEIDVDDFGVLPKGVIPGTKTFLHQNVFGFLVRCGRSLYCLREMRPGFCLMPLPMLSSRLSSLSIPVASAAMLRGITSKSEKRGRCPGRDMLPRRSVGFLYTIVFREVFQAIRNLVSGRIS